MYKGPYFAYIYVPCRNSASINWILWASQVVLVVKNLPANAGDARDASSILGSGRSPGEGNGNPLQYSCLKNPMDEGAWQARVHGIAESDMTERLGTHSVLHFEASCYIFSISFTWWVSALPVRNSSRVISGRMLPWHLCSPEGCLCSLLCVPVVLHVYFNYLKLL